MSPSRCGWRRAPLVAAALLLHPLLAHAIVATYCSSENTAKGPPIAVIPHMSEGFCQVHCNDLDENWAYSVTQYESCWCSDTKPGILLALDDCNLLCPGYPVYEYCGSRKKDLFNYLELGPKPSGTAAGSIAPKPSPTTSHTSTHTSTHTSSPVSITRTVPTTITTTKVSSGPSSVVTEPPTTIVTTKLRTITTDASPSLTTVTSISVTTINGVATTETVRSVESAPAESGGTPQVTQEHSGLSGGAIAGIVIGVVIALAFIGILVYFCCCRTRRRRDSQDGDEPGLNRNTSVLSKVGLLRSSSPRRSAPPPASTTRGATAAAVAAVGAPSSISSKPPRLQTDIPISSVGPSSAATATTMTSRRDSRPIFVDQRLNPNALMANENASRTSVGTLQDNQDYSRPLEVRNPDAGR